MQSWMFDVECPMLDVLPAMTDTLWSHVDRYICDHLLASDPVLDAALAASTAAGLPEISVTPNQGKLLHLLATIRGARHILEIGTLGGYSTIWLARALPFEGRLDEVAVYARELSPEALAAHAAKLLR